MNMDASTMHVDYGIARERVREYRARVAEIAETDPVGAPKSEDEQMRRAFQAILDGKLVIDINLAIQSGGLDPQGRPKLAIARADWPFVHCWWRDNRVVFSAGERRWSHVGLAQQFSHNVRVAFHPAPRDQNIAAKAQVPTIPPKYKPRGALSRYRILFEAEWRRVPPVDPILLRHLGGPFYVVLAQWDLTSVEQAILRARF